MNIVPKFDPNLPEVTFSEDCRVNTPDDVLMEQVSTNIRRGLPQVFAHQPNGDTVIIVAGGPSLESTEDELVEAYWKGGKVVAVNGAYQWCIDRNIRPSAMVMMDARRFNARFVETPVERCRYLLASQCHPDAFELCRGRDVTIWHAVSAGEPEVALLDEFYFDNYLTAGSEGTHRYFPVTLGTTVSLRAISLMRMLGFTSFEIFGLDSCNLEGNHHAYAQAENDSDQIMPVWLRPSGRDDLATRFVCTVWQAKQFNDFLELVKERGELFRLNVHGPGLIATALKLGSEIEIDTGPEFPTAAITAA